MAELKQNPDGSLSIYRESDSAVMIRSGGPKTPQPSTMSAAGSPSTASGASYTSNLVAQIPVAALTTANLTGGAVNWTNPDGVDCIIAKTELNVLATSGIGNVTLEVGLSSNSTVAPSSFLLKALLGTPGLTAATGSTYVTAGTPVIATIAGNGTAAAQANLRLHYANVV